MSHIIVDAHRRYALMRAHTATHLLHAALCKILPQTKQAGSYVGEDELRFDFFTDRLLDQTELDTMTQQINEIIRQHLPVTMTEMSYEDAIASGAKAFFEDKYPERVRVVAVKSEEGGVNNNQAISVELCGGTHVADTSQIGAFVITEQSAVAAGVKRIVALTGTKVIDYLSLLSKEKNSFADKVGVPAKQLEAKIEKLLTEHTELSQKVQKLSSALIANKAVVPGNIGDIALDLVWSYEAQGFADTVDFAEVVSYLRSNPKLASRLLTSSSGQYALYHPQAREISKKLALKGGGSENFVQGRDEKVVGLV